MFAKTFDSELYGQLLAVKDTDDDQRPAVRIYMEPPEMGVCSVVIGWEDTDKGWSVRDTYFENLTIEPVEEAAKSLFDKVAELYSGLEED